MSTGTRSGLEDVSYINVAGTFHCLSTVLDGCSRAIVRWDIRASMTEQEAECILQRARELHPGVTPRIISDNGPQFVARDRATAASGVHPGHRHDPCPNLPLLPPVKVLQTGSS